MAVTSNFSDQKLTLNRKKSEKKTTEQKQSKRKKTVLAITK